MQKSGDGIENRALASTIRADQRDNFSLLNIERNAFDGMDCAIVDIDILD